MYARAEGRTSDGGPRDNKAETETLAGMLHLDERGGLISGRGKHLKRPPFDNAAAAAA